MLSKYFCAAARIREFRSGPAGAFLEGFSEALFQRGYAIITARRHVRCAEHIVHWSGQRGVSVSSLGNRDLGLFERHLSRCRCGHYARTKRLESFAVHAYSCDIFKVSANPQSLNQLRPLATQRCWRSFASGCERSAAPVS